MNQGFISAVQPPAHLTEPAVWFIFQAYHLLVYTTGDQVDLPRISHPSELGLTLWRQQYLGQCTAGERPFHAFTAEVAPDTPAPAGMAFQGLRSLLGQLADPAFWLAGRAVQIIDWDRTTQFCGQCGQRTHMLSHERAKQCPDCRQTIYPRLSPAIIVAITRHTEGGKRLLLARSHRQPPGFYSVLAGFVEPGETLETAVQREIQEEVGLQVTNLRYFGSQPWPFPNSLMVAFTADYAGGEIVLDETEMAEADWYAADALPRIPPAISIARQLIDNFVQQTE